VDGEGQQRGYRPPAPFAPPALRTPPLNEWQVLGRSTYPDSQLHPPPAVPPGVTQWYPGQGWVPHPHKATERTLRHRTVIVVASVVAALLTLVGFLAITDSGPRTHTLSLPDTAGPYVKLSTLSPSHITTIFGSNGTFGSIPSADLAHAKVGVYGRGSGGAPTLLFVGFSADQSPTIGEQLRSEDSAQVTQDVLYGAGGATAPQIVDAGPLGGSMKCSNVRVDGLDAAVGVWADSDTLGVVLLFDPTVIPGPESTGAVTRTFRSRAEH
jgi:hypothetical protein